MLRRLNPAADGPALHALYGDEESCRYLLGPANKTVEETVRQLTEWNKGAEDTTWAIVDAPDGPALGRVTLFPQRDTVWEVGIMLTPQARGRGLAYASLAEAIDTVFARHEVRRLVADIDPDNAPSIRLFERLGFQKEGVFRENWVTHLGPRDSAMFGLLSTDPRPWTELAERLR